MKKLVLIAAFLSMYVSSCTPGAPTTLKDDMKAGQTPSATLVPTQTATKTSSPTATRTPTVTPSPTPDLSILGDPATPFPPRWPKPTYKSDAYDVYQRNIHGRSITMAWEKGAHIPERTRIQVSDYYFQTFIQYWDIFQGFPYDSHTIILKTNGHPGNHGETGVGYEQDIQLYGTGLMGDVPQIIAHEVLHAWIWDAICFKNETKFSDHLWFDEGITQYYGDRAAGKAYYLDAIKGHFDRYTGSMLGTEYDVPLSDMPAKSWTAGDDMTKRQYSLFVYKKGALVAYMMDEKLGEQGLTLDDLLKYLYDNYALQKKCVNTRNVIEALNTITGNDWKPFFDAYIYGTERLPLNGRFVNTAHPVADRNY